MNKKELINRVSAELGMTKTATNDVVDVVFETIAETLKAHEEVAISGFGKFCTVYKEAKEGRNPQTGEVLEIEARYAPKFKPSSALKELVR